MNNDQIKRSIESLAPEQRALLEQRLRQRSRKATGIARRPNPDLYPLTPGQERLWRLSRLRPADPVYNVTQAWRLTGQLRLEALSEALKEVVARHPALRGRFTDVDGRPNQSLRSVDEFAVTVAPGLNADADAAEVDAQIKRLVAQPLDLTSDPLIRLTVIEAGPLDHIVVLTVHHIVCDGISLRILIDDLSDAYSRRVAGEPQAELPPEQQSTVTYFDVAHWLQNLDTTKDLEFWRENLSTVSEAIRLPSVRSSGSPSSLSGQSMTFTFRKEVFDGLRATARKAGTSDFAVLLAALVASIHSTTKQDCMVVATPVANRNHPEIEQMVGYFNDVVPLVVDVGSAQTSTELIASCLEVVTAALDHATVPLQDLAGLEEMASVPLSRCLIALQEGEDSQLVLPGVASTVIPASAVSADFDLAFFLDPEGDAITCTVIYRSSHFTPADIDVYAKNFETALDSISNDPSQSPAELPVKPLEVPLDEPDGDPVRATLPRVPESPAEAKMVSIWSELFGVPVGPDDDFFDLGGHSLLAAELADRIAADFEVEDLVLSALFQAPTPSHLVSFIGSDVAERGWESLVPIKVTGDRPPLFFVHAHGGNVIGYSDLARNLSERQPLYGLQAPPFDADSPPRLEDLASTYIAEVRAVQPNGPYLVGGWCLGGDIAFDMARQLTEEGEEVALVVMVDNPRPEVLSESPAERMRMRAELEWVNLIEQPIAGVPDYLGGRVGRVAERFAVGLERRFTSTDGELPMGINHSRSYNRSEAVVSRERAYELYSPRPYAGRVALFRAEVESKERRQVFGLGWEPFVTGRLDEYILPGPRIGMLSEPRVAESARIIEDVIESALDDFP